MLRSFTENYARRARELSDAVALLGRHGEAGPEFAGLLQRIRRLRELCGEAEEELSRYLLREQRNDKGQGAA
jgi:hypothetical protein